MDSADRTILPATRRAAYVRALTFYERSWARQLRLEVVYDLAHDVPAWDVEADLRQVLNGALWSEEQAACIQHTIAALPSLAGRADF